MRLKFKSLLQIGYVLFAFAFMIYYLIDNWPGLRAFGWRFDIFFLIAAIAAFCLAILGPVFVFRMIFVKLTGYRFNFLQIFKIFNLSFIGRYLPGKIWGLLGMIYYAGEYGIGKRMSAAAVVINEVCYKGSGLLWGLVYFALSSRNANLVFAVVPAITIGLILIHPRILNAIVNRLSSLFKQEPVELSIDYVSILFYFAAYLTFWGVYGAGFYLLIKSVGVLFPGDFMTITAFFPLAWTAGNLAIFIPGGIGVREGLLVLLLSGYLGPETALVIAILQRILTTLIEGLNALLALLIKKRPVETGP